MSYSYSARFNAIGGPFSTSGIWTPFASGSQSCEFSSDHSVATISIPVTPGAIVDVGVWYEEAGNRSTAVPHALAAGVVTLASVTVDQTQSTSTEGTAVGTGTISGDPNTTSQDGTQQTFLKLGTFTVPAGIHALALEVNGTGAGVAILDTVFVGSNLPIPQPAKVNAVQVGPSGRTIVCRITDQSGNPLLLSAVDGTKLPTIQVNGGAGNGQSGSTGTVQLANPIWESTSQSDPASYVVFPTTFPLGPTDVVTFACQVAWCTTSAGACDTVSGLAAQNLSGGSFLPRFVPGSKTMKVGTNIDQPSPLQPVLPFADLIRQLGDWVDDSGHYDFTVDSAGNLLTMGSASFLKAEIIQPLPNPADSSKVYCAGPAGEYILVSQGGTCQLFSANDNTTVTPGTPTTVGGITTAPYDAAATDPSQGVGVALEVTAAPCKILHIWRPGVATDGSVTYGPEFLRMGGGYKCLRFMDGLQTNNSNVAAFGDFNAQSNLSYARQQNKTFGGIVTQIQPYNNADGIYPNDGVIPILVTTSQPHGMTGDGQSVAFSGFQGPGETGGGPYLGQFPLSSPTGTINLNGNGSLAHVLSSTTFSVRLAPNNARTPGQALGGTYTSLGASPKVSGSNQIGWAPIEMINLCNLLGCDLWINVPHAASDACVTTLFQTVVSLLKPNLRVHVEYSNETWNSQFLQNGYCLEQGLLAGLTLHQWYVKRANHVHNLARAALTAAGWTGTMLRVIGSQFTDPANTGKERLDYAVSQGYPVDEFAVADYFWNGPIGTVPGSTFNGLNQAQRMDLSELYLTGGYIAGYIAANLAQLRSHYPNASLVCYEGGPEYGGLAGSGDLGAISRAWGRDPRQYNGMLAFLQINQDNGVALYNDYRLFGSAGGINGVANSTNYPAYFGYAMTDGTGNPAENPSPDNLAAGAVVSEKGGALHRWAALANRRPTKRWFSGLYPN